MQAATKAATAVHTTEIKRLERKNVKQKVALVKARQMVRNVEDEIKRMYDEAAAMGIERWANRTSSRDTSANSSGTSHDSTRSPSHDATATSPLQSAFRWSAISDDDISSDDDDDDEKLEYSDEENLEDEVVVDSEFFGSGIHFGQQSGDEGGKTHRKAKTRQAIVDVGNNLSFVGARLDPTVFDAEPWASTNANTGTRAI